jgi:hypothetical protein
MLIRKREGLVVHRCAAALLAVGLLFVLSGTAPVLAGDEPLQGPIDPRWLPWLGKWEPEVDRNAREFQRPGAVQELRVLPASDGISVKIQAAGEQTEDLQDLITPDGIRQPIDKLGCQGWKQASWSADGRRLFTRSSITCGQDLERSLSGLMMISPDGRWTHVQLAETAGHRSLWVQRYRYVGDLGIAFPRLTPDPVTARRLAGSPLRAEDVIEAAAKVDPEVIEAALLETRSAFDIDSRLLLRLADSGVPEQVIDLMVALSFPSRFTIDSGEIAEIPRAAPVTPRYSGSGAYWPYYAYPSAYYGHLFHLGWYSPFYSYYDPWLYPYSPFWRTRSPFFGVPGGVISPGLRSGGRVIEGRGYTRVRERETEQGTTVRRAQPRGGSGSAASSGGVSTARDSGGSGSSGGASRGASPGGYSSGSSGGDSSSGRQAKPRDN